MPKNHVFALALVVISSLFLVSPALAQEQTTAPPPVVPQEQPQQGADLSTGGGDNHTEVGFFLGGMVGGDISGLLTDGFSLSSTLENGRAYGGRVGYYTYPFGVEGSFAYSDHGLGITADLDEATVSLGARVMYLEANALLIIIPGPVQPFATVGGGLHSYEFKDLAGIEVTKFGWNFGGGLKINIKRVTLRADVRDHITSISAADLNIDQELADLLDIGTQSIHNVEISFGIGVRF